MAQGLCVDLCHRLWVQRVEQAAVLAAVPKLPGEVTGALWSDRETGERCSLGVLQ